MSHIWIIIQQWAIVINLATGQTFLIINTQWVCLSKWHEWWHFEVPRYREELKDRFGGVLSFNHYFLSLFEYYGNSLLSLAPESRPRALLLIRWRKRVRRLWTS